MRRARVFAVAALAAVAAGGGLPANAAPSRPFIDLHAHLFMDDGMGTLFHGKFEGELRARDWTARLDSQINEAALGRSELGLIVVSLYAHPALTDDRRESIRRQLDRARAFVATHPSWVIATGARQAREARAAGKGVLVLALEGASGILETEDDLREFIDEKGIRIVTFLHLTDDHYGGSAFFEGVRGFFMSPVSWFLQMFSPTVDETGAKLNRNGLTADGRALAAKLIARHVWLDLAHASDDAQMALIPLLVEARQPLLYTHTVLRRYKHEERALNDWQLEAVRATHGIVGLLPSEEMLDTTPPDSNVCGDGIHALATQFTAVAGRLGASSTSIGSDFNGGVTHLRPPRCATRTLLDAEGLWNIGQSGRMWTALKALGVPWPASSDDFITTFLAAWSQVHS